MKIGIEDDLKKQDQKIEKAKVRKLVRENNLVSPGKVKPAKRRVHDHDDDSVNNTKLNASTNEFLSESSHENVANL